MVGIVDVGGPVFGHQVNHQECLGREEENGEEEKGRAPDTTGEGQARMVIDAMVPELGPTKEHNEAPEGIEDREEEKANRFRPIEGSTEHVHHLPGAMEISASESDP